MHTLYHPKKMVSVIIPAYNEAFTIQNVVNVALTHPFVDEVIVVDDGSSDGTASAAFAVGARIVRSSRNQGKAFAMDAGVRAARNNLLFFIDADIVGLTHAMMDIAIQSVLTRASGMFVLIVDHPFLGARHFLDMLPLLGGVRVLRREIWDEVPADCKKGFEIELALNYFARRLEARIGYRMIPGLSQIIKEKKRGLVAGFFQRLLMFRDIGAIIFKLYVMYPLRHIYNPSRTLVRYK